MNLNIIYDHGIFAKIRLWGLKGVWNYLLGYLPNHWRRWRLKRFFLDNVRRYPMQSMRGITLIAGFTTRGSINKVFVVDVGFIKRKKNVGVLQLISDLETIAAHFMKSTYGNARVMNVSHDPLYDDERLRTESLFQGVLTLRLQEVS